MVKSVKKIFSSLLITFFLLLACLPWFVGCGEKSVKEITIKVPRSSTLNSVARPDLESVTALLTHASEEFAAQYGKEIKVKVVEFESGEETKAVYNTFGTPDAADILYDSFYNMSSFIHTGNAVPLDDILSDEMAKDLNSKYVDNGRFDKKLYMMPYMVSQNILIYNKQLLRQCGLDAYIGENGTISDWPIEDWTAILNTLAEKLPTGYVPTMMYAKDNEGDTHIMTLLRSYGSDLFDEDVNFKLDGKAVEALRWIQNGVTNGWYLPVPYYKTMSDNSSKFKTGEMAFFNFNSAGPMYRSVIAEGGLDKYGFVNYPGNNCTFFCEGFEVFDNGDSEKIEIAKDFVKYFYATDKWMECSAGSIPVSNKVLKKFEDKILLLDAFLDNAVNEVDFRRNLPNWQGAENSVGSVFHKEIANLLIRDANGNFAFTPEECARILEIKLNEAINSGRTNSHPHE